MLDLWCLFARSEVGNDSALKHLHHETRERSREFTVIATLAAFISDKCVLSRDLVKLWASAAAGIVWIETTHAELDPSVVHRCTDLIPSLARHVVVLQPKDHGDFALVGQFTVRDADQRVVFLACTEGGAVDVCAEPAERCEYPRIECGLSSCQPRATTLINVRGERDGLQGTCRWLGTRR